MDSVSLNEVTTIRRITIYFSLKMFISKYKYNLKVGLAVVNNNLMAIGGFDGTTYLKTIEIYDSELQIWKLNNSMIYRR